MSLLKTIIVYLFGPTEEILAAQIQPPRQILTEEQLHKLRKQVEGKD